jgi:hypothetical protein
MLVLHGSTAVSSICDPGIRRLVEQRFTEIQAGEHYDYDLHGYSIVVEPGDTVEALEKESSCPILHDPFDGTRYGNPEFSPFYEALEEHPCCYEMVFILNDEGFGISLFIPKADGIDAVLLSMCARYASALTPP